MVVVLSSLPSRNEAEKVARLLVENNLVACFQIGSPMQSYYEWEGRLCCEEEIPVVLKLDELHLKEAQSVFLEHHPYDVPEWVILRAEASFEYLNWIKNGG